MSQASHGKKWYPGQLIYLVSDSAKQFCIFLWSICSIYNLTRVIVRKVDCRVIKKKKKGKVYAFSDSFLGDSKESTMAKAVIKGVKRINHSSCSLCELNTEHLCESEKPWCREHWTRTPAVPPKIICIVNQWSVNCILCQVTFAREAWWVFPNKTQNSITFLYFSLPVPQLSNLLSGWNLSNQHLYSTCTHFTVTGNQESLKSFG